MRVGFVGLGRMGFNMVTRLAREGHELVATTCDQASAKVLAALRNELGGDPARAASP